MVGRGGKVHDACNRQSLESLVYSSRGESTKQHQQLPKKLDITGPHHLLTQQHRDLNSRSHISFCNRLLIIQGIILGHGKTKKVVWTLAVTGILGKNLQKKLIVSLLIGFEPVASCIAVLIANHYTISQVYRKFVKIESYFYIWYIFGKKFLLRQELRQPFLDSP